MLASILGFLKDCILAFVPLFFAFDAVGVLPLYLGLTDGVEPSARRRVLWESVATALAVALGFVLFGRGVLRLLGVTVNDFMVAGGALLFLLATRDIMSGEKPVRLTPTGIGAVPLGTPLIAGPAVLTMSLILVDVYGWTATIVAVVANVLLVGGILSVADMATGLLGKAGVRVASKVSNLLMAAIAVMMIRRGLAEIIAAM